MNKPTFGGYLAEICQFVRPKSEKRPTKCGKPKDILSAGKLRLEKHYDLSLGALESGVPKTPVMLPNPL